MPPLVSFLIPAYNHERFIEQCLDSVLAESYENKEIVVIDDGSKDRTPAIIEEWVERHKDDIPIRFRSRANRGVAATLNELIDLARGDFLRLGASDDYFLPGGARRQVEYLTANPRKLAVIGDSIIVDDRGTVVHRSGMADLHGANKRGYRTDRGIIKSVISDWAVAGPVPMIRKDAFLLLGGWNEHLRIDDWDFFLRVAARDGLGFIDVPVCAYRLHDTNTCRVSDRQTRIENLRESRAVAEKHMGLFTSPYRELLQAQCRLIDAKVAYLERRIWALGMSLIRYSLLRIRIRVVWNEL